MAGKSLPFFVLCLRQLLPETKALFAGEGKNFSLVDTGDSALLDDHFALGDDAQDMAGFETVDEVTAEVFGGYFRGAVVVQNYQVVCIDSPTPPVALMNRCTLRKRAYI